MSKKILYKKSELLGNDSYGSSAMRDILSKDEQKHVLNQTREKKQLFRELKKYRDGGVTKKELKGVLAGLKYGSSDYFDVSEINTLAKELNLGNIAKKHLMSKSLLHNSKIDTANHDVNYSRKNSINKTRGTRGNRNMPNDDVVHYEVNKSVKKIFGDKYKEMVVDGGMMFEREQEEVEFVDRGTGKKFYSRASRLKRPEFHVKSQTSFRGRGLIAGKRI